MESRDLLRRHSESEIPATASYSQKQRLVNTIELYWQDVQKEMLFLIPSFYMHIWLGGV